jgi:hypothetical protein
MPIVSCKIGVTESSMFMHSGSKLSYLRKGMVSKYTQVGKEHDFYPGMGEFDTPVYEVPITLGKEQFMLQCGVLPVLLERAILSPDRSGIIGTELFQKYTVSLAIGEKSMVLGKILGS